MRAVIIAALATSLPLVLFGLVGARRWRMIGGAIIVMVSLIVALSLQVIVPSDLWILPVYSGMQFDLLLLLLWGLFGALARSAGPLTLPGPPIVVAAGMGALLGEIPAAAILAVGARDKAAAARLALAAAGGGMVGRLGDPALLLMGGRAPEVVAFVAPLGLLSVLIARPRRDDLVEGGVGGIARTGLLLAVAAAAVVPGWTLPAVICGIVVLAVMTRSRRGPIDLAGFSWVVMATVLTLVAIAGGAPEHMARGLEEVAEGLGHWLLPGLTLAGALLGALGDGTAGSLLGLSVLDRAMSLQMEGVRGALTAGLAVGGLGPLIAAGSLRAGWRRWLLQVLVAIAYVAVLA